MLRPQRIELGQLHRDNRSWKLAETQGEGRRTMAQSPTDMPGRTSFESAEESVLTASLGDQPTSLDHLGFTPYVEAVAEFLTNENTEPPLTLSVEGEWGSGKSSFLK